MAGLNKEINLPRGVALAVGMVFGSHAGPARYRGCRGRIPDGDRQLACRHPGHGSDGRYFQQTRQSLHYGRRAYRVRSHRFRPLGRGCDLRSLWGTYAIGIPALAWVGGAYVCSLFDIAQYPWGLVCALMILLASTIVNLLGTRLTALINTISLWMIAALICILVGTHLDLLVLGIRELPSITTGFDLSGLISGAGLIVWAFLGWAQRTASRHLYEDQPQWRARQCADRHAGHLYGRYRHRRASASQGR